MDQQALATRISEIAQLTEAQLTLLLHSARRPSEITRPALLMEAMRYGVLGGGKRFRPFLVMEVARLFGCAGEGPLRAGAALELIHCYSLAHDDLPAMDDDDLRRGKPTLHKAYDDAIGILAGDALLTLAFDVIADRKTARSAAVRVKLVQLVAQAAGCGGMVGGQMLDLAAEGRYRGRMAKPSGETGIIRIQSMKTGALILAACRMGAILGGAKKADIQALDAYAKALGLAFQIKDDLLDIEGNAATLGKAAGKDAEAGKATFAKLRGIEGAKALLEDITTQGKAALAPFGETGQTLQALMDFNRLRSS
jgi:farnesyl diphosphate synthase